MPQGQYGKRIGNVMETGPPSSQLPTQLVLSPSD